MHVSVGVNDPLVPALDRSMPVDGARKGHATEHVEPPSQMALDANGIGVGVGVLKQAMIGPTPKMAVREVSVAFMASRMRRCEALSWASTARTSSSSSRASWWRTRSTGVAGTAGPGHDGRRR